MFVKRGNEELLFVGRISAQKGLELLIRAMREVVMSHPRCKLLVIGQGPDQHFMHTLSKAIGWNVTLNLSVRLKMKSS
ncbi:MAG: glycosyltransferase [Propionivibrio sp.]|nr:glycosyltransferase [Propionivibrio sp.]